MLLPLQVLFLGPLFVGVLVVGGRWLARDGRAFRPLLWAWPAGLVLTFLAGGRPYYVLPLTIAVALAGVAGCAGPGLRWATVAASGAVAVLLALPVLPVSAVAVTGAVNESVAETVGWPELVEQVAGVVDELPPDEQAGVVLLTGSYGEAGAIDRFGPAHGLPPAYSPHNGYADFRRPADDSATVVAVRYGPADGYLADFFDQCTQVATVDNGQDVDNEIAGHADPRLPRAARHVGRRVGGAPLPVVTGTQPRPSGVVVGLVGRLAEHLAVAQDGDGTVLAHDDHRGAGVVQAVAPRRGVAHAAEAGDLRLRLGRGHEAHAELAQHAVAVERRRRRRPGPARGAAAPGRTGG